MTETERLPCSHCGHEHSVILESRTDDETQITQRKYRCHGCNKFFYVLVKTQFHYDDAETLVYTMRLRYGVLPSVKAKKLEAQRRATSVALADHRGR